MLRVDDVSFDPRKLRSLGRREGKPPVGSFRVVQAQAGGLPCCLSGERASGRTVVLGACRAVSDVLNLCRVIEQFQLPPPFLITIKVSRGGNLVWW